MKVNHPLTEPRKGKRALLFACTCGSGVRDTRMIDTSPKVSLRQLIEIKHGFAFSSEFFCERGEKVLLTPGNFKEEGGFRWLGEKQKFFEGKFPPGFVLVPGQMLIAMTEQAPGLLGSTMFVPNDGYTYLHNQRLGLIENLRPDKLDLNFLHYFFSSVEARRKISAEAAGTKVKHTSPDRIRSLEVFLPPFSVQQQIAAILRTWDEAIDKLGTLRAAKESRLRALTHALVFGSRQLDRFRNADEVTSHRWFTLPASWGYKPIGGLAKEISERNAKGANYDVLSCTKHDGFVMSLEYFKKQVFSADLSGYKKVWRGDFGFPNNHIEEGSIGLQNLTDVGVVSPIYTVFRFATEKVDIDYAVAVLKTKLYRHIFKINTSASVDRRGSLRWSEFSKLPFPVPPLAEQKAIADVLRTAQSELDVLSIEIESLVRQKRGLLQKLLTWEWRVAVNQPSAGEPIQ